MFINRRPDPAGRRPRGRPRIRRIIRQKPPAVYFKPRGVPLSSLQEVILSFEEVEALRLTEIKGLDQKKAAKKMKVSRPTFQRVLAQARQKSAQGLVKGYAICVKGGDWDMPRGRGLGLGRGAGRPVAAGGRGRMGGPLAAGPNGVCVCSKCKHEIPHRIGSPCYDIKCPKCGSPMTRKEK